jgi:hypothetical protein
VNSPAFASIFSLEIRKGIGLNKGFAAACWYDYLTARFAAIYVPTGLSLMLFKLLHLNSPYAMHKA